jgi:hypothetical protein
MGSFMKGLSGKAMGLAPKMGQVGGANLPESAGLEGSPIPPYPGIESAPEPSMGHRIGQGFRRFGQQQAGLPMQPFGNNPMGSNREDEMMRLLQALLQRR